MGMIVFDKYITLIKKLIGDYFTGSVTIHFSEGTLMKVEVKEVMRNL